jgi:hypothetical protein
MAYPKKDGVVTESVVFNGRKYNRYPNAKNNAHKRYYTIGGGGSLLHRDIWEFHNGSIPDGHHVHHKDGDWSNNSIENLECIPASEHYKQHAQYTSEFQKTPEQVAHFAKIQGLAAEWHRSEEGRAWHRENTGKHLKPGGAARVAREKSLKERRENPFKLVCFVCKKPFDALSLKAKFCSNTCACRDSRKNKRAKAGLQPVG